MVTIAYLATLLIGIPWFFMIFVPALVGIFILFLPLAILMSKRAEGHALAFARQKEQVSVLVADDDEISVTPLLLALGEKLRVEIKFVENGQMALDALKEKKFDLLFLDLSMPILDGRDVLALGDSILKMEKKLPVVIYSNVLKDEENALNGVSVLNKFKIMGVWKKTISYHLLCNRLDHVLEECAV